MINQLGGGGRGGGGGGGRDRLWKSIKHNSEENDPILSRSFIADINISDGIATYHIKLQ